MQGPKAIENSLLNHGYNISFNELFLDIITACSLDELGIYDNLYGFVNADFQIFRHRTVTRYPKTFTDIKHRFYDVELKELYYLLNEFTLIVETPEISTRSLGTIIIIHDENGWTVEQLILLGTGSKEYLHCTGQNIDEAYVITSLLKEGITFAPSSFSASPFSLLNLSIVPEHQKPARTNSYTILTIATTLLLMCNLVIMIKKKRK
ncbi:MAG: hypothetical protein HGN29_06455 [Asgard group archaeon]|nr:hypothetical protein [Asgard group archaeon]